MKTKTNTLSLELLQKMDAYRRAANYLSVGQIYLYDNPLLKKPLTVAHVKHMLHMLHMLLGHWGQIYLLLIKGCLIEYISMMDRAIGKFLKEQEKKKQGSLS
jgi:phosphoketolase